MWARAGQAYRDPGGWTDKDREDGPSVTTPWRDRDKHSSQQQTLPSPLSLSARNGPRTVSYSWIDNVMTF